MDYPIRVTTEETSASKNNLVDEEIIAIAIAELVRMARQQGQSLDLLVADVLRDDCVLDPNRRKWLSELVVRAWAIVP